MRGALLLCAVLLVGLALASSAAADVFGPIALVSTTTYQQFEYAHDPAISGDGRYVAFDGSLGGVKGVWRAELLREASGRLYTGKVEQVAGGDAELPSISEEGRYVSFTTGEGGRLAALTDGQPDSSPHEETPNVYVRDMSKPPGETGAFTLASDLTYEYPAGPQQAKEEVEYGAEAAGRTALSANGQKVVFVTTAASDLDGPGTPPLQVAVHDLETGKTEIVSVADDLATGEPSVNEATGLPEPVPLRSEGGSEAEGGSVYGAVYTEGGRRPIFRAPEPYAIPSGAGASISADGSTVAWMGQDIGAQALVLAGEAGETKYSEPLWRRIVDPAGQPSEQERTRRVTGGSDPEAPQCATHHEECQGPFADEGLGIWNGAAPDYIVPQLSADGEMVAFVASAPLVSQGEDFGIGPLTHPSDLYVSDMHAGLTRVQALRQVSELAGGDETQISTDAPILDFAISADGTQVAFTTKRTVFLLSSPAFVSSLAAVPGLAELYDADLADDTLTRVTQGYVGGPAEHPHAEEEREDPYQEEDDGSLSPSFTGNGDALAFSSTASNLVYGDGNTPPLNYPLDDGSDAFVLERLQFGATPTPQYVSSAPALAVAPSWRLGVTARSLGDGDVLLYVQTPGAGTVGVRAGSPVRAQARAARSSRTARRKRSRSSHARAAVAVVTRAVAGTTRAVAAGGLTTVLLTLDSAYRALAAQHGGLSARASVTFAAPGHPALRQSIAVTFVRAAPKRRASRGSRAAKRARSKRRGGAR